MPNVKQSNLARLLAGGAMAAVLSGCDPASAPTPGPPHPLPEPPRMATCEPGKPGGRLVIATAAAPRSFNPVFATDNASDEIVRLLVGSLVQYDFAKPEAVPGLAESWSVEPDQKTWTFKLRRGLRWSDGAPLTAADVAFTWNEVTYNPRVRAPLAGVFRVNGKNFTVAASDELTLRVVTPEVFAPMLEFFGSVPVLPKHALGNAARAGDFLHSYGVTTRPGRIVGAGPFRLKEHRAGQSTLLERNPEYWAADRTGQRLPYLEEIRFVVATNADNIAARFLAGQADVCERIGAEGFARFQAGAAAGRFQWVELGPGAERDFLWFNQNTNVHRISGQPFVVPHKLSWFRNTTFRQAVSCAINRERLIREVYAGRAVPAETYVGAENPRWNNPAVPRFGYDVKRARALLAQAGLEDRNGDGVAEDTEGRPCEIVFHTNAGNPAREKAALLIQDDLRRLGVKLVYQALPFTALERKINESFDYECALMGLSGGGLDPASHLNVLKSDDLMHQWFPAQATPSSAWEARLDALMDAQIRTLDFAARKRAFDEVQMILAGQLPMIGTVTPTLRAAARADLANLRGSALTPYRLTWNLEELYLRPR